MKDLTEHSARNMLSTDLTRSVLPYCCLMDGTLPLSRGRDGKVDTVQDATKANGVVWTTFMTAVTEHLPTMILLEESVKLFEKVDGYKEHYKVWRLDQSGGLSLYLFVVVGERE